MAGKPATKGKGKQKRKSAAPPIPPSQRDQLLRYISFGVHELAAAGAAGVTRWRYVYWIRRGRQALERVQDKLDGVDLDRDAGELLAELIEPDELKYAHFAMEVEQAIDRAEMGYSFSVHQGAQMDWRAAAWWLERRRGDVYGAKDTVRLGFERPPGAMTNDELVAELRTLGFVQAAVVQGEPVAAALAPELTQSAQGQTNGVHAPSSTQGGTSNGHGHGSGG